MYQQLAWQWSVLLTVVAIAAFLFVAIRSGSAVDYAPIQERGYRLRSRFFALLLLLGIPTLVATLVFTPLPYAAAAAGSEGRQVVHAVGHQWYWELSRSELKANQPVEFRVTSADVNHGFGIYDDSLQLLAQVQAMPGYTNLMNYTFTEPGTYKVLCMEYCGVVHHAMLAEITVTD